MRTLAFLLCLSPTLLAQSLTPSSAEPGTPEESGIVTTLALQYQKIRNTVRDMYQSIQYGKAMVQAVDDQRAWFNRNIQGWRDVGRRVMRIADDPARWDKKLIALEEVFDRTDVLLFQEPRRFDELMSRQERYLKGIGQGVAAISNYPLVADFYEYNSALYREGESHIPDLAGADAPTNAWLKERERQRLADAKTAIVNQGSGRIRDATILAASQAQAQLASLRAMREQRAQNYERNYSYLKGDRPNQKEMVTAFNNLKALDAEMDLLILRNIELQLIWTQLGHVTYDLTSVRESQISTTESMDALAGALK